MSDSLRGRVALVTGAGSGIGRATAIQLATRGARVGLMGRRRQPLEQTAAELRQSGLDGLVLPGDVCSAADCRAVVSRLLAETEGLDILVNNAGLYQPARAEDTDEESWQRHLDANLTAVWRLSLECLPALRRSSSAVIINVSSTVAQRPVPGVAAYVVSKAGLEALTKTLALELAADGVRVNAVLPGIVDTPIHSARPGHDHDNFVREAGAMHPLGRLGDPADVAAAIGFLASPEAAWVTGALLPVDGGIQLA